MPKGVKPEDEDRKIIGEKDGRYFREIPEDRRLLACDLLEWSRTIEHHRKQWDQWQQEEQLITLSRPQSIAMSSLALHVIRNGQKLTLLSQDAYDAVIVQCPQTGQRWKLPVQGGYEDLA